MSQVTNIEWCDSTVNPTSGCGGCELWNGQRRICYAGTLQETRLSRNPQFANLYAGDFTEVRMLPGRMAGAAAWSDLRGMARPEKPWLDGLPRHIFVGDLGDIFSAEVDFDFLQREVLSAIVSERGRRHRWMLLTKRPGRMSVWQTWLRSVGISWPENIIAMTTVTDQGTAVARIDSLLELENRGVRVPTMLSAEPLLGPIDFERIPGFARIGGVIVGGASGAGATETPLEWLLSIVGACRRQSVPVFVKQIGSLPTLGGSPFGAPSRKGGDPARWPEALRAREFPKFLP